MPDVGGEADRDDDDAEREQELAGAAPSGGRGAAGRRPGRDRPRASSAFLSIWRIRPQLAQVWIRACRPMPHLGQVTDELVAAVEQTVDPLG